VIGQASSKSTVLAKSSDLRQLAEWQESRGSRAGLPLDVEELLEFCDWLAFEARDTRKDGVGFAPSTIARKLASISVAHQVAGFESPTGNPAISAFLRGLAKESEAQKHAKPLRIEALTLVIRALWASGDDEGRKLRDRAVLLLGFAAALRRSELAALDVRDFEDAPKGAIVHVRRSKTDQAGKGHAIPVYAKTIYCPVGAVREWLAFRARVEGEVGLDSPLFCGIKAAGTLRKGGPLRGLRMDGRTIDRIIRARASAAGFTGCSGHSLRAGFCISARESGSSEFAIRRITRHRSVATLHRYYSGSALFDEDPIKHWDELVTIS
jgi:integrase